MVARRKAVLAPRMGVAVRISAQAMFPSSLHPRLFCRTFAFRPPTQTRGFFSNPFARKQSVPTIYKPRRERWITPTILLVGFIPFFTFGLGTWQMRRLQWKINLIDELKEKLDLPALALPKKIKCALHPFPLLLVRCHPKSLSYSGIRLAESLRQGKI